jgi:hypothetical protein
MRRFKTLQLGVMALALVGCGTGEEVDDVETTSAALFSGGIANGEYLFQGQMVWSPSCTYRVVMQGDGNLVVYNNVSGAAMWNAGTVGHPGAFAVLQGDGNFVIYPRDSGTALWGVGNFGGQKLIMQNDSNLVLYNYILNPFGTAVWSSGTVRTPTGSCTTPRRSESTFVQGNVDRPGGNLPNMPFASPNYRACGNSCAGRSDCRACSFTPGQCWLKGAVPASVAHTGIVSGVKNRLCNGATSC